jgi:hypothetical protein
MRYAVFSEKVPSMVYSMSVDWRVIGGSPWLHASEPFLTVAVLDWP